LALIGAEVFAATLQRRRVLSERARKPTARTTRHEIFLEWNGVPRWDSRNVN
jgi:hypothetical protein